MNETRSVSEQCSCLVDVRDSERTERRQPDRKRSGGRGQLPSRRLGWHQTRESVLLITLRYRHHHRLLVVDALYPSVSVALVSTCSARPCLSQHSPVRRSCMRLLGRRPCCHPAGGQWTWMRLCRSSVQLPCQASAQCDAAALVSTSLSRHSHGQRLSVRRSLMGVQVCRQPTPPDASCTLLVD